MDPMQPASATAAASDDAAAPADAAMAWIAPAMGAREWNRHALGTLRQEAARSADTHLLNLDFPGFPGIDFYFKDEAAHPTGSLKHRLARSLFLYALCNGRLRAGPDRSSMRLPAAPRFPKRGSRACSGCRSSR